MWWGGWDLAARVWGILSFTPSSCFAHQVPENLLHCPNFPLITFGVKEGIIEQLLRNFRKKRVMVSNGESIHPRDSHLYEMTPI
jgi:hypothetical protein